MEQRFDDHSKMAAATREDVREIRKRIEDGDRLFADVRTALVKIETTMIVLTKAQTDHQSYLADHNNRIAKLERDESKRDGERGVWAGLVKSPAFAWIAAMIAGLVAFVSNAAKGH
jgi:hypothetical protein